jgi:hypothetical protein
LILHKRSVKFSILNANKSTKSRKRKSPNYSKKLIEAVVQAVKFQKSIEFAWAALWSVNFFVTTIVWVSKNLEISSSLKNFKFFEIRHNLGQNFTTSQKFQSFQEYKIINSKYEVNLSDLRCVERYMSWI